MSETPQMKLKFSAQAAMLIRQNKEWNMEDFKSWFLKEGFQVGSKPILEYLIIRDCRENGDPKPLEVALDGAERRS